MQPILSIADSKMRFYLFVSISNVAFGAPLSQQSENNCYRSISCYNKMQNGSQHNYNKKRIKRH